MNKLRESISKHFQDAFEILSKRKKELMEELDRIERKLSESTDLDERLECRLAFDRSVLQILRHLGRIVLEAKSYINPTTETQLASRPICLHSQQDDSAQAVLVVTDDFDKTFSLVNSNHETSNKTFSCGPPLSPDMIIGGVGRIRDKIIISIYNKDVLYKLSRDGKFEKTIGSSGHGKDQFSGPSDLSTHEDHLLVCERDNSRVQVLRNYNHSHFIGWYDNLPGVLRKPRSVSVGPNRDVFVLHSGITSILIYTFSGEPKASLSALSVGAMEMGDSSRLSVTPGGDILVCGGNEGSLYCFHRDLTTCFIYRSNKDSSFHKPWDLCTGTNGQVTLADIEKRSLLTFNIDKLILW